jgi:Caspase domain
MRWTSTIAAAGLLQLIGCAGSRMTPATPVNPAPEGVAGAAVFVAETEVTGGNSGAARHRDVLWRSLGPLLTGANYRLVADAADADLVLTPAGAFEENWGCDGGSHLSVAELRVTKDGKTLAKPSLRPAACGAEGQTPAVAVALVNAMTAALRGYAGKITRTPPPASGAAVPVAAASVPPPTTAAPPPPPSSVATAAPQRTAYALVVGIEHYRDLPPPPGAKADAEAFAAMLKTTLGIPDANVRLAVDDRASKSDVERSLSWLKNNVPPSGRVYFFFSGHGAPGAGSGASYLVPYDGDAQALEETSIPLDKVLAALGETKAKETIAFVDACFSGAGGRSVLPKGARPLIKLKEVSAAKAVAVFAASSGTQISGPSQEGRNGAFTKYLLQAIGDAKADANGDGQLTLKELADWVTPRVEREAKAQSRDQTPKLTFGSMLGDPKDLAVAWGLK